MSLTSMKGEAASKSVLQKDELRDISDRLMEVCYSDFASKKIPVLPKDITPDDIKYYYYLYFESAYYEKGSYFAKQNVKFHNEKDEFVVTKKAIDEIANLFGRKNVNLKDYLYSDYSSTYSDASKSYTVKPISFAGYHNKETFDYTFNNIEIAKDTAVVSYNTYYTDDYNKFWKYSGDFEKMPDWSFNVKVGIYKFHYKAANGIIVLNKTEYVAMPDFRFYTQ